MLRIPCPKCRKTSYTADVESFYSCSYCGFKFSGKHGPDRRRESRAAEVIPLVFSYRDHDFKASTSDISEKGIGIKISGKPSILIGDVLTLTIRNVSMAAKVMWMKRLSDGDLAGLQKVH
jgi:hypothetical protein